MGVINKQLYIQCVWCKKNSAQWFAKHPGSSQDCYFCRNCRLYFVYPHESWIPSITDGFENSDEFQFWGDSEAQTAYVLWRSIENTRIAETIMKEKKLDRIFEIGFGEGPLTSLLIDKCEEYWGIEPVPASLDRTVEHFKLNRDRVFACRAEDMLNEPSLRDCVGFFDTIILVSVLEHISSPVKVLEDCYRLLAPNGRLFVSVPDSTFFKALVNIRHLLNMEPWSYFHISFFSPKALKQGFKSIGFNLISESCHSLVTKASADYFGKLNHSSLITYMMNVGRFVLLDRLLRINTLFYILEKN